VLISSLATIIHSPSNLWYWPVHSGFLVTLNRILGGDFQIKQTNKKSSLNAARGTCNITSALYLFKCYYASLLFMCFCVAVVCQHFLIISSPLLCTPSPFVSWLSYSLSFLAHSSYFYAFVFSQLFG
jgi:hypothetical protein